MNTRARLNQRARYVASVLLLEGNAEEAVDKPGTLGKRPKIGKAFVCPGFLQAANNIQSQSGLRERGGLLSGNGKPRLG